MGLLIKLLDTIVIIPQKHVGTVKQNHAWKYFILFNIITE